MTYTEFLESKRVVALDRGSSVDPKTFAKHLFPHQKDISQWAIRGGNRAIFASFGLGKTHIQIQILKSILAKSPGAGLIICPLEVKAEFVRDGRQFFNVEFRYVRTNEEAAEAIADGAQFLITNYERVRDGDLDPNQFQVVSLDEASVLRSFGSKTYQTFLTLFERVPNKFVCTATPSPNRYKELIHYAGFLGIMDTGQALTRFFKRDSQQAGNLQLHPHKEREFWLWVSTWATFLTKPSDLGYDDVGYNLPPMEIVKHRLPVDHSTAGFDSWGQGKLLRNAATSVSDGAREKRDSLEIRIAQARRIVDEGGAGRHWIIWHDLETERHAIEKAFPEAEVVYGSRDLEEREDIIAAFTDGLFRILGTKPSLSGSGCNFQKHCHSAIFLGITYKFNDIIQAVHRIYRFLQTHTVQIHFIYTESEDAVWDTFTKKWEQDKHLRENMSAIIQQNGLSNARASEEQITRSTGVTRQEVKGQLFEAINNDNVIEMERIPDASVDLIVTSIPFSDHYEYSESYHDFGHNDGDKGFFEQMEFLTPHLLRALKPGRLFCCHTKDRLLYGSMTGLGMYSVNPFSDKCVEHYRKHGFIYCGRIPIDTDVVRENSQTYRLGWSENAKDGTKMGVGSPEFVLLFRKLPSDTSRAYADVPVIHDKEWYSRSRWQLHASAIWRSNGNRFLTPEEIKNLPQPALREIWKKYSYENIYDFEEHVRVCEEIEKEGCLPAAFMLLPPATHSPWIWSDITRMRTLNCEQSRKRQEFHVCPLQFDVVERLIDRYSNPGERVLDPFAGLMTVPYCAIQRGRLGIGIELNSGYWMDGVAYCQAAEQKVLTPGLFDALEAEESYVGASLGTPSQLEVDGVRAIGRQS